MTEQSKNRCSNCYYWLRLPAQPILGKCSKMGRPSPESALCKDWRELCPRVVEYKETLDA